MKQNNKKFNNAMHKFVGVLDKYDVSPSQDTWHSATMSISAFPWM